MQRFIFFLLVIASLQSCAIFRSAEKTLPPIDKPSYLELYADFGPQTLTISLINRLPVERCVVLSSTNDTLQALLEGSNPLQLPGDSVTVSLEIPLPQKIDEETWRTSIRGRSFLGNPTTARPDTTYRYTLPFPPGKTCRILQGFNGSYSHYRDYNRYALDFAMPVGDTICAVRDGIVGYLFADSEIGGKGDAYTEYGNSIMIRHDDGTIAQYSHLAPQGVFVKIGERVEAGQPIGRSGLTGNTDSPHLHLNLMRPTPEALISIPLDFQDVQGASLIRNVRVSH